MSPVKTAPAELTAGDAALRTQYLNEVLDLLYPWPCRTDGSPGTPIAEYLVVPDARRPRLLVPSASRRVAAAAVRRYAEPQSRSARLKRDAVVAAVRTGASAVLLRDRVRVTGPFSSSIDGYLSEQLGRELSVSVHIGPARANRKPVLQLIGPEGDTFGFGKLGTGPLTRALVRAETAAIRHRAIHEDEGRLGILVLAVMAAVASLGVIGAEMRSPGGPLDLAMLGITIFLSWALIHTVFAIHYAHAYYDCDDSQSDTNDGQAGGFVFPGNAEPDYLDFVYVSFVIGMTSQVSDVAVTSRSIRRTVLVHSVIAFAFNTALLALAINLAASAVFGK